jgi:hypothetical protein
MISAVGNSPVFLHFLYLGYLNVAPLIFCPVGDVCRALCHGGEWGRFGNEVQKLIRLATLTKADLAFVRQHRGDHNRLGIAVLMSYLRYPGRVLAEHERSHDRDPGLNVGDDFPVWTLR